jgi:hypothetical protein
MYRTPLSAEFGDEHVVQAVPTMLLEDHVSRLPPDYMMIYISCSLDCLHKQLARYIHVSLMATCNLHLGAVRERIRQSHAGENYIATHACGCRFVVSLEKNASDLTYYKGKCACAALSLKQADTMQHREQVLPMCTLSIDT